MRYFTKQLYACCYSKNILISVLIYSKTMLLTIVFEKCVILKHFCSLLHVKKQ